MDSVAHGGIQWHNMAYPPYPGPSPRKKLSRIICFRFHRQKKSMFMQELRMHTHAFRGHDEGIRWKTNTHAHTCAHRM